MWEQWQAGVSALRAPLVVGLCLLCFVVGAMSATPTDTAPPVVTQPTSAVTDESVRALARALEAAVSATPPVTAPEVAEAEEVLDEVRTGQVQVTPPSTEPPAWQPPPTTSTTVTTTTTAPSVDNVVRWPVPTSTVPAPTTVTVP